MRLSTGGRGACGSPNRCRRLGAALLLAFALPAAGHAQEHREEPAAPARLVTWTFSAGLGSSKAWNLVSIAGEVFLGERASVFVTAGLGEMLLGAGVALYGNPRGSGPVLSAAAGTGLQATLTYRWMLGRSDCVVLGASYVRAFGFSDVDRPRVVPVLAYENRF